jgi:hypothetical protein
MSRVDVIRIRDNRKTVVVRFCRSRRSTLPNGERAHPEDGIAILVESATSN